VISSKTTSIGKKNYDNIKNKMLPILDFSKKIMIFFKYSVFSDKIIPLYIQSYKRYLKSTLRKIVLFY